ncbi:carbon-nitrogen hydrolase family protein [Alteribacillus iranensis]|uniref:Predicted amidohydrolase n=1 Tax=Alteribacillus iranensis TaxID=930128 RepID=A0A1I2BB30_9BACI|nr:carbon-nitrogen hydrolase family protein [Alteribacillus iranensis]SFE53269.1 Predicted amidohydrolase [Alteribacillus iranensis]
MSVNEVKTAVVQTDPKLGEVAHNLQETKYWVKEAHKQGAKLAVFPECSLTGYQFQDEASSRESALRIGDTWTQELQQLAKETDIHIVVGFVEDAGEDLYNALLVIAPDGELFKHRKAHLSNLGVDNFILQGEDPFEVFDTSIGKLGCFICYEARFPEHSRSLVLDGADILVHITNLPETANDQVDLLLPARANENRVFLLSSGRVGEENGYRYLGRSSIYGVEGEVLDQADRTSETIIYSTIDLEVARNKEVYYPPRDGKPKGHINPLFSRRRPELYSRLVQQ